MSREIKARFAGLPAIQALQQIRCGFELEYANNGDAELDEDAVLEAISDAWDDLSYSAIVSDFVQKTEDARLVRVYDDNDCYLSAEGRERVEEILGTAREQHAQWCWETWNLSDYTNSESPDVPATCEVGSDSSVPRGGEIRTIGGLTAREFLAAARSIFEANTSLEINTGCSFHIHLSIPGMEHVYGPNIQAELEAFLLENRSRLPTAVQARLRSAAIRWCNFQISKDKMTAVHFHRQGTWEFRLFGNVDNYRNAATCLRLAVAALQHAYCVSLGVGPSLLPVGWDNQFIPDWFESGKEKALAALANRMRNEDIRRETTAA